MMPTLQEGELEFTFPPGTRAVKFDGSLHGLSHCMKAVDFIVDFGGFYLFVEVKDPDDTKATAERRAQFVGELQQPEFTRKLSLKYRDSLLYRWAEQQPEKPVRYVVLLQLATFQPAQYATIDQALKCAIPAQGTPATWTRAVVDGVAVVDMGVWNALGAYGTVRRV